MAQRSIDSVLGNGGLATRDEGDGLRMTVGELARRTGMSRRAVRELEGRGLIYSAGRSEANYRLFDESALWCVRVIRDLRSLGLMLKEIEQLAAVYIDSPEEPIGPHLADLLERADQRIAEQLAELISLQRRIEQFRTDNAAVLAGTGDAELALGVPRRLGTSSP
jgi:MerR family copper efflux transcriptional regulator